MMVLLHVRQVRQSSEAEDAGVGTGPRLRRKVLRRTDSPRANGFGSTNRPWI